MGNQIMIAFLNFSPASSEVFTEIEIVIMWEKCFKMEVAKGGRHKLPTFSVYFQSEPRLGTLRLHAGEKMKQNDSHD